MSKWFSFISVVVIIGLAGCESITVRTNLGRNFDKAGIGEEPVAVVPDQPSKAGDLFADLVSNELLGLGFRIIERIHLETILREQQLSLTGLLERQDYGQIGKLANIRRLFVVSALFSPNFGNVANATIRLIDLKTGEVLMSTTYGDPNANIYPPQNTKTESVKKIADSIAENIGSGGSRP